MINIALVPEDITSAEVQAKFLQPIEEQAIAAMHGLHSLVQFPGPNWTRLWGTCIAAIAVD